MAFQLRHTLNALGQVVQPPRPALSPENLALAIIAGPLVKNFESQAVQIDSLWASFHLSWKCLAGPIYFELECSNDGSNWDKKEDAFYVTPEAQNRAGNKLISLNGVATESFYRLVITCEAPANMANKKLGDFSCVIVQKPSL